MQLKPGTPGDRANLKPLTHLAVLALSLVLVFGLAACSQAMASNGHDSSSNTSEKDTSTERQTDGGLFQVRYQSELEPAAINQMHTWVLHVETADGLPVEQAEISVQGAMPDHGHGLPTAPRVTEDLGGGDYRVEGIRYSMPGWWTMTCEISAGGQSDTVTFNLVLP